VAGHGRTSGGKGRRGRGTNHYPEGIRLTRRHTFFLVPARSIVDSHLLENFALHALHSHSHFVGATWSAQRGRMLSGRILRRRNAGRVCVYHLRGGLEGRGVVVLTQSLSTTAVPVMDVGGGKSGEMGKKDGDTVRCVH